MHDLIWKGCLPFLPLLVTSVRVCVRLAKRYAVLVVLIHGPRLWV